MTGGLFALSRAALPVLRREESEVRDILSNVTNYWKVSIFSLYIFKLSGRMLPVPESWEEWGAGYPLQLYQVLEGEQFALYVLVLSGRTIPVPESWEEWGAGYPLQLYQVLEGEQFALYVLVLSERAVCLRAEKSEVRDIHSSSTRYWKVSSLLCMH